MDRQQHHFEPLAPRHDLGAFDCGDEQYNKWLQNSARTAVQAGTAAVTVLVREDESGVEVIGYFALCPTGVVRDGMPNKAKASSIDPITAYLLAKLALAEKCRGDKVQMWGTQLLLGAFRQVLAARESGGHTAARSLHAPRPRARERGVRAAPSPAALPPRCHRARSPGRGA